MRTQAPEQARRIDEGLRAVHAWEAENGAITAAEAAAADRFLGGPAAERDPVD
jgi:hypothetical protein